MRKDAEVMAISDNRIAGNDFPSGSPYKALRRFFMPCPNKSMLNDI